MAIDEIRLGPISLQLCEAPDDHEKLIVVAANKALGAVSASAGVEVTQEQWDDAARVAGLRRQVT